MLQGARRLKEEGLDVVIGLVETHGRAETSALVEGLEVLPRRMVEYHGRAIAEFDLDAALARKPALIIVDELAHTNAPESRHPKRWQDVQELLAAGIDVWTALNIQHLESLADVVLRISGVVVRETVPDRVLQQANDVVLVDITPDELIQRLHEGKVYSPNGAARDEESLHSRQPDRAPRARFRRTADRVDDQMVDILCEKAIQGPWGASERLLACVGPMSFRSVARRGVSSRPASTRPGRRYISSPSVSRATPGRRCRSPRLSVSPSGSAETDATPGQQLSGRNPAAGAPRKRDPDRARPVARRGVAASIGRSLADALMRQAGTIEIHVVPMRSPESFGLAEIQPEAQFQGLASSSRPRSRRSPAPLASAKC